MKLSLRPFSLALFAVLSLGLGACATPSEGASEPSVAQEAEIGTPSLIGVYRPAGADDDQFFDKVTVTKSGEKLTLILDEFGNERTLTLSKTSSGAFVFTTGDLDGDCDDPGCAF